MLCLYLDWNGRVWRESGNKLGRALCCDVNVLVLLGKHFHSFFAFCPWTISRISHVGGLAGKASNLITKVINTSIDTHFTKVVPDYSTHTHTLWSRDSDWHITDNQHTMVATSKRASTQGMLPGSQSFLALSRNLQWKGRHTHVKRQGTATANMGGLACSLISSSGLSLQRNLCRSISHSSNHACCTFCWCPLKLHGHPHWTSAVQLW